MWSYEFLVEDGRPSVTFQRRKTINSRIATRCPTSQRPTAGWLKEARPDSWPSHSPVPWQWALSHRMPVKPGGQWHRWWWWHVPPFWHRSMALSHTRAAENTRRKGQGRQEGRLMDHTGIRGEFIGHKPPHRVPSASICVLKAQQARQGGQNQRLPQGSERGQDAHSAHESPQTNADEQRKWTDNFMDYWYF